MKFEEVLTMLTLVADEPFASAAIIYVIIRQRRIAS